MNKIEVEDIALGTSGIRIPDPKSGKTQKFVPWGLLNRERVIPNIDKITGKNRDNNFEFYYVRKTVNGVQLEQIYPTKRDAMKAIDIFLIRNGRKPLHILKKND